MSKVVLVAFELREGALVEELLDELPRPLEGAVESWWQAAEDANVPVPVVAGGGLVQQIAEAIEDALADEYGTFLDGGTPSGIAHLVAPRVVSLVEAQVAPLRDEVAEYAELCDRQASLLTRTINVLRGDPPDLTSWSHHDVPEQALEVVLRAVAAEADAGKLARWVDEVKVGRDAWALRGINAESALRQVRELAETWDGYGHGLYNIHPERNLPCSVCDLLAQLRAILDSARVGAADTQPEGAGLNCPVCGSGEEGDCICAAAEALGIYVKDPDEWGETR